MSDERPVTSLISDGLLLQCRICGRVGKRGFITMYGQHAGDSIYCCANRAACARREEKAR